MTLSKKRCFTFFIFVSKVNRLNKTGCIEIVKCFINCGEEIPCNIMWITRGGNYIHFTVEFSSEKSLAFCLVNWIHPFTEPCMVVWSKAGRWSQPPRKAKLTENQVYFPLIVWNTLSTMMIDSQIKATLFVCFMFSVLSAMYEMKL